MKEVYTFSYQVADIENITQEQQNLLQSARQARKNAYAPYSNFHVGAAVLLSNGEVVLGNNQENAAYPSGICAERAAIFAAMANQPSASIIRLAIAAGKKGDPFPISPCGSCRQVLVEYENRQKKQFEILFEFGDDKVIIVDAAADLLPFAFRADMLNARD
ncbi:MAG: cytidine deaminase [Weeksellaceae bacterium]|nr:cytidine deaminase [Weeksellaceae bacterium]